MIFLTTVIVFLFHNGIVDYELLCYKIYRPCAITIVSVPKTQPTMCPDPTNPNLLPAMDLYLIYYSWTNKWLTEIRNWNLLSSSAIPDFILTATASERNVSQLMLPAQQDSVASTSRRPKIDNESFSLTIAGQHSATVDYIN